MLVLIIILLYRYIFIPAIVWWVITLVKKTKQANKTENYNRMMNRYIYKVPMQAEELLDTLGRKNVYESLYCTIDQENHVITLSNPTNPREYKKYCYSIHEAVDFSILRIEEIYSFRRKGYLHLKVNPFILQKLNAEKMVYYQNIDSWETAFGRGE